MAPELLEELPPAYRKLWRMLESRHGALETARLFAKLLSVVAGEAARRWPPLSSKPWPPAGRRSRKAGIKLSMGSAEDCYDKEDIYRMEARIANSEAR